jgi:hypothetical protein
MPLLSPRPGLIESIECPQEIKLFADRAKSALNEGSFERVFLVFGVQQ